MEPSREFKERELEGLYLQLSKGDKNLVLWNARWRYVKHLTVGRFYKRIPSRRAHWLYPRPHRYERRLFFWLAVIVVITSKPETLLYNVLIGMALSFGFMLYLYYQLVTSREND